MISRLYWASKIYFTSYGIAWFDLDLFIKMLKYIHSRGVVTSKELNNFILTTYRERFSKTERENYYYEQLLRHLELAIVVKKHKVKYVSLTNYGKSVLRKISKSKSPKETKETFKNIFLNWPPLQAFLKYIYSKGKVSWKDIVEDLGGEMKKWTKILYEVGVRVAGLRKTGVKKPFNKFVVRNLFIPLSQQLNLVDKCNGKLQINPEAKEAVENITLEKEYDIIKTMPGEYTIYSAIADTLSDAKEAIIASPWINGTIVELVKNTYKIWKKPQQITIIVRKDRKQLNLHHIRQLTKTPINIEAYYYNRLHAKITANPQGPATVSSANLRETSLLRNYEIGTYYQKTPTTIITALQELMSIATKITI